MTKQLPFALAALAVLTCGQSARAGGPLTANGTPVQTSEYAIDLFHGPVFAGARVTGLAGSYVAIAEDVDGDLQNPAAPAVRPFFSYTHFDYWLGFGLTFPADLQNMDFFNSGSKTNIANPPDSFVFLTPALNLQWGDLGVGANIEIQQYALSSVDEGTGSRQATVRVSIPTTHVQFAHGLFHNQWVLGVGARLVTMSLHEEQARTAFKSSGEGLEFGAVFKPENVPLRLGAAFRTAVRTEASYRDGLLPDENGDLVITSDAGTPIYLPKAVACPWDLNFGFALQFGKRPFNPPWRTNTELNEKASLEHRLRQLEREKRKDSARRAAKTREERAAIDRAFRVEQAADDAKLDRQFETEHRRIENDLAKMNRHYVQLSASMLLSGPVDEAVGVESLVSQTVNRSGQRLVMSPRAGVEVGVIPTWLKVRGGSYLEPTRFDGSEARVHATAGLDVRLLVWNVFGLWPDDYMWRLGLGGDASRRYYTWGLTIAGWYPRNTKPPPPEVAE